MRSRLISPALTLGLLGALTSKKRCEDMRCQGGLDYVDFCDALIAKMRRYSCGYQDTWCNGLRCPARNWHLQCYVKER